MSPKSGSEVRAFRYAETQPTICPAVSATQALQFSSGGGWAIICRVDATPRTR